MRHVQQGRCWGGHTEPCPAAQLCLLGTSGGPTGQAATVHFNSGARFRSSGKRKGEAYELLPMHSVPAAARPAQPGKPFLLVFKLAWKMKSSQDALAPRTCYCRLGVPINTFLIYNLALLYKWKTRNAFKSSFRSPRFSACPLADMNANTPQAPAAVPPAARGHQASTWALVKFGFCACRPRRMGSQMWGVQG